jgi:transposase
MYYVGIDIAKRNHVVALLDNGGNLLMKPFSFPNTASGCDKVLAAFLKHNVPKDKVVIGMEATGHYWLSVYSFFTDYGFDVKVVNPIQSEGLRALNIRKVKNDSVDSVCIADLMRFGKFSNCSVPDENIVALKNLSRYRFALVDSCSDLKRRAITILDQVFPEYDSLFSDIFGLTSKELLQKFTTPDEFVAVSTTRLSNFIEKASNGRLGRIKAEQVKAAAQNSFGIKYAISSFSFQLRQILEQITFIENQIEELEAKLFELLEISGMGIITTITGFGNILASAVAGEIADISKFNAAPQLVAYAGLDASIKQSGQFEGNRNSISKRGSPYLRRAVWQAAMIASFRDPALSLYYQSLISRGKHHKTAVTAVARKLCNILWAVLKTRIPYTPHFKN